MCSQLICISNSKQRFDTSPSLEVLAEHTRKSGNAHKKVIQALLNWNESNRNFLINEDTTLISERFVHFTKEKTITHFNNGSFLKKKEQN